MNTLDIEEGAGEVSRGLKIDDKRAEELKDLCCDSVAKFDTITEVMDIMQMIAKNDNELAYCNYRIGVCSRCPASAIKKHMEREDDVDNTLSDFWKKHKNRRKDDKD